MLVPNPAAPHSRSLRLGRVLEEEGYEVEIAAQEAPGLPSEAIEGSILVHRYPAGPHRSSVDASQVGPGVLGSWSWPPAPYRTWWASLGRYLEPADLIHAVGVWSLPPALAAGTRGRGRPIVVYDVVDDWFHSHAAQSMPRLARIWHAGAERRRAHRADAITTINETQARVYEQRWHTRRPVISVPNYPIIPDRPSGAADLIRTLLGLPGEALIVLFHGEIGTLRPLRIVEEAVLRIPRAVAVFMGYGHGWERMRARDSDSRYLGRHFTLPAVHPDELLDWVAGADVSVGRLRASSLNDRRTTTNKFWEAVAVGTPVLVGRPQEPMARMIEEHDLGAVIEAYTVEAVSAALASVLDRPAAERAAWRARISGHARLAWNWPVAEEAYRRELRAVTMERQSGRT